MTNRFDSFDKYGLDHLIQHLLKAARSDDAARIARSLAYLDAKARRLGPASLLEDHEVLQIGLPAGFSAWKDLNRLYGLVRQEAHAFRDWNPEDLPLLFLQQIRNKASREQWRSVQTEAEQLLSNRGPWLQLLRHAGLAGSQVTRAMEHGACVQTVAFSPDGKQVASGGNDHIVRLWDVKTDREIRQFRGHQGRVTGIAFSPDGHRLASVADEGWSSSIRLWEPRSGNEIWRQVKRGGMTCVAFSQDGRFIATGDDNGAACLWTRDEGALLRTFEHPDHVHGVSFSHDATTVASACDDGYVRLWPVAMDAEPRCLGGHEGRCTSVAFSPGEEQVAYGVSSPEGAVYVWDLRLDRPLWKHKAWSLPTTGSTHVQSVAFSSDSRLVSMGAWSNRTTLLDATTGRKLREWTGHNRPVLSVAFSPDSRLIASSSLDGSVRLWRVPSPSERLSPVQLLQVYAKTLRAFATYSLSAARCLISLSTQWHPLARLWLRRRYGTADKTVAFSQHGHVAAVALPQENVVHIWNMRTRTQTDEISGRGARVRNLALSADGTTLGIEFLNGVGIYAMSEVEEDHWIPLKTSLNSLALSPRGDLLACGTWEGEIQLWNVKRETLLAKHQIDGIEPHLWFSTNDCTLQIIDFSMSTLTPNMWWLRVEAWQG